MPRLGIYIAGSRDFSAFAMLGAWLKQTPDAEMVSSYHDFDTDTMKYKISWKGFSERFEHPEGGPIMCFGLESTSKGLVVV